MLVSCSCCCHDVGRVGSCTDLDMWPVTQEEELKNWVTDSSSTRRKAQDPEKQHHAVQRCARSVSVRNLQAGPDPERPARVSEVESERSHSAVYLVSEHASQFSPRSRAECSGRGCTLSRRCFTCPINALHRAVHSLKWINPSLIRQFRVFYFTSNSYKLCRCPKIFGPNCRDHIENDSRTIVLLDW